MADEDVAAVARATASRLAPQYGPRLEADVEAAIYGNGAQPPQEQYVDPIALGSLLVSTATLGWQVYNDLVKRGERPVAEALAQRIRVERRAVGDLVNAEEKIIEIVSVEVVKRADDG